MTTSTSPTTATEAIIEPVVNLEKQVVAGDLDTTDTNARYLAYGARLRPLLVSASRYAAYTSDVGESVRPSVHPKWVTAAYGVSWAYLAGDCAYEGYKSKLRAVQYAPEDQGLVVGLGIAKRAIFQSTASMLLPSLTIHSIVKYSSKYIQSSTSSTFKKNPRIKAFLPSFLGLSFIPALPFLFDEPVEGAVDRLFEFGEEKFLSDRPEVRRALNAHHGEKVEV